MTTFEERDLLREIYRKGGVTPDILNRIRDIVGILEAPCPLCLTMECKLHVKYIYPREDVGSTFLRDVDSPRAALFPSTRWVMLPFAQTLPAGWQIDLSTTAPHEVQVFTTLPSGALHGPLLLWQVGVLAGSRNTLTCTLTNSGWQVSEGTACPAHPAEWTDIGCPPSPEMIDECIAMNGYPEDRKTPYGSP